MKHRILFCSKQYKQTPIYLSKFLDNRKYLIENCSQKELDEKIMKADVAVPLMTILDKNLINLADNLKLIHQFGVGLEGVDINAATKRGIYVANIPAHNTGNAYSVSELTLFLILALLKNFKQSQDSLKKKIIGFPVGDTLIGKHFLVLGYGNVGKAVVDILQKFKVNITVARRSVKDNTDKSINFIQLSDIEQNLKEFDFVIAALSLNKDTKDFVDEKIFYNMKKDAFFINIARGGVVKYNALLNALKSNKIKGAGLDVYWYEPFDPEDEIFNYNVIATPHIAGSTILSYNLMAKIMATNIVKVLEKNNPPDNWANPF